ncbi:hypothetical protein IGI04_020287, partial [Brassica rapa subsp. trilocularis]
KTVLENALYCSLKELLMEIRDSGYRITDELMCVLIGSWGKLTGRVEEALKQLETMGVRKMSPNEATLRALVHGVFRCLPKACSYVNLVTFNTFLSGYSAMGDVNKVHQVLEKLLEHGCKPDVITFNIGRSVKLFAEVQENGLSPDVYAYNAVKKAEELIKTMLRIGLKPDNFTYSGLIKSFK